MTDQNKTHGVLTDAIGNPQDEAHDCRIAAPQSPVAPADEQPRYNYGPDGKGPVSLLNGDRLRDLVRDIRSAAPTPPTSAADAAIEQRDIAIQMLAKWCCDIDRNGTGWDDWDENYKNAKYRPGPLRNLLDAAIAASKKESGDE